PVSPMSSTVTSCAAARVRGPVSAASDGVRRNSSAVIASRAAAPRAAALCEPPDRPSNVCPTPSWLLVIVNSPAGPAPLLPPRTASCGWGFPSADQDRGGEGWAGGKEGVKQWGCRQGGP